MRLDETYAVGKTQENKEKGHVQFLVTSLLSANTALSNAKF